MTHLKDFVNLDEGIRNHIIEESKKIKIFLPFYEKALLFMEVRNIFPHNDFSQKRINMIGRNLAFTIFFAMHNLYEEGQIILRQIIDLIFVIIYGSNHVLELDEIDKGFKFRIGNIRTEVEAKLPSELKAKLQKLYRKLSCVVHGTVKDILSQVNSVRESWESPQKLGHWKNDFHLALELSLCLCKSWLQENYAKLDISVRSNLEDKFTDLKLLGIS